MNIKVEEAAKLMGKSANYVRLAMQKGMLPIGIAKQSPQGKYSYYISPKLFEEFTGIKIEEIKKENIEPTKPENSL